MAQHDGVIDNASGAAVRADLNNYLNAALTNNSGSTAPTTTYPHQWWFDSATNLLKQRNSANTAWVAVAKKDGAGWQPYYKGANADTVFAKLAGAALTGATLDGKASTDFVLIAAKASNAETVTGTSTTKWTTPAGVAAAIDAKVFGVGKTWQDVTASRSPNTTYTNNTPNTITVSMQPSSGSATGNFYVDGVVVAKTNIGDFSSPNIIIDIQPSETYLFDQSIFHWAEKRP